MLTDNRTVFLTVENMDVSAGYSVKATAAKDVQGSVIDVTNDRNLTRFNIPANSCLCDSNLLGMYKLFPL